MFNHFGTVSAIVGVWFGACAMFVFLALSILYPTDRLSGFAMATKTCTNDRLLGFAMATKTCTNDRPSHIGGRIIVMQVHFMFTKQRPE